MVIEKISSKNQISKKEIHQRLSWDEYLLKKKT